MITSSKLGSGMQTLLTVGLGGGGTMYSPVISPHDPSLMFVACDMGGLYRLQRSSSSSDTFTATMADQREIAVDYGFQNGDINRARPYRIAFDPTSPNWVYVGGSQGELRKLRVSDQLGKKGSWKTLWGPSDNVRETIVAVGVDGNRKVYVGTQSWDDRNAGRIFAQNNQGQFVPCQDQNGTNITQVTVGFTFLTDPTTTPPQSAFFLATRSKVYKFNPTNSRWEDITGELPVSGDGIRGFCGGADANHLVLYATVPGSSGVYRYRRSGTKYIWEPVTQQPEQNAQYHSIAMATTSPDTVYVSTNSARIYRSSNMGNAWEPVYNCPGPANSYCHFSRPGWLELDRGFGFGGPPWGLAVCPPDPDIAAFTHAGGVYVAPPHGNVGELDWVAAYTTPVGSRTPNQRWLSNGTEVTTVWHYYVDPHEPLRHYICYTDIGFAFSQDGGETWRYGAPTIGQHIYNTVYELAFDPVNPGHIWAAVADLHDIPYPKSFDASGGGRVLKSTDFGQSWSDPHVSGLDPAPVVSVIYDRVTNPAQPRLWASVYGRGVLFSVDGGERWTQFNNGLSGSDNMNTYRLHLHADGTLFCSKTGYLASGGPSAAGTGLWRLPTGSNSWQNITNTLPADQAYVVDYAVHPTNPNYIYLCKFHALDYSLPSGCVFKTTNGGTNWAEVLSAANLEPRYTTIYDTSFFAPFFDPDDPDHTAYVTTVGDGTRRTTNEGQSWQEVHLNVPFLRTQRILFGRDGSGPLTIYISTFGGGVFKQTDTLIDTL